MSFSDDKFLPTRTGTPTGASNERTMLDNVGGADGFKTKMRVSADGNTTTMLRTKNGMPQFETTTKTTPVTKGVKTGDLLLTWAMFNTRNHDTTFKAAVINTKTFEVIDSQPCGKVREIGDYAGLRTENGISLNHMFLLGGDPFATAYRGYQGGSEMTIHYMFGQKVLDVKRALLAEYPHGYPNLPSLWGEWDWSAVQYHRDHVGINGVNYIGFSNLWSYTPSAAYEISRTVHGVKSSGDYVYSLMQSQDWSDGTARVYLQEWRNNAGSAALNTTLVPELHSYWSAGGLIETDDTRIYISYYLPVTGSDPVPVTKVFKQGLVPDGSYNMQLSRWQTVSHALDWYIWGITETQVELRPYPWSEWAGWAPRTITKHSPFWPDVLIFTGTHVMFFCQADSLPFDKASVDLPLHNDGSYSGLKVALHIYTILGVYVKSIELDSATPFASSDPQGSASDPEPQLGITYFVRPVRTVSFPQKNGGAIFLTKPLASLK